MKLLYCPLYGHHQPHTKPPKITHSLTEKELITYEQRYHAAITKNLPWEVLPEHYHALGLPKLPLITEPSEEIRRLPLPNLGHHNQVRVENLPLQTSATLTEVYYYKYRPLDPAPVHSKVYPIDHLINLCRDWQIPLESAVRFLVWEMRRAGTIPYLVPELKALEKYFPMENHILRLQMAQEHHLLSS